METLFQKVQRIGVKGSIEGLIFRFRQKKAQFFMNLSRKYLKHEGGLDGHFTGYAKYHLIRLFSNVKTTGNHELLAKDLLENQYAKVDLNIPSETLQKIQAKISEYIEDENYSSPRGKRSPADGKFYSRALKKLAVNIPEVKEIISPELDDMIKEYFGTNYAVTSVLCWRNYHVPETNENKYFYSNEWHNDYMEPKELKLFINMTDVTEDDGPLHVVSSSTTTEWVDRGVFQGRQNPANDIAAMETSNGLIRHTGKAGSSVFCHTSTCLHRADIPKEGHYRDMLEFQFRPAISPLPEDWENTKMKYA